MKMADVTNDKEKFGCSAWLESIRGTVNERWTRARNSLQRKVHRGNKTAQPHSPVVQLADPGSGDPVVTRKRVLRPRPATVDIKEDIKCLRAMISTLDAADFVKEDTFADKCDFGGNRDEFPETEIDVNTLINEILRKVCEELEEELTSSFVTTTSSTFTVTGSTSVTSSELSGIAGTVVNDSLVRMISPFDDFELDIDLNIECKKLQNEVDSGMYCNEFIEVAE